MNDVSLDVTEKDILQAVRESAVLAEVSISVWQGRMSDPTLMREVKDRHGVTASDAGTVHKNLLAGVDDLLRATKNAYLAIRALHYEMTIPWVNDAHAQRNEGPRLLPHMLTDRYMVEIFKRKRAAEQKLDELCEAWPGIVQQALANLKTMATANDYPSVDRLRDSFRIYIGFEPVPDSASFGGLNNFMFERLTKSLDKRQQRQVEQATREIWQRAAEPIKHLIERLTDDPTTGSDGKAKKFKDATVENVRELLTYLPGWNVMNDPQTAEIIDDIRTLLDGLSGEALRQDKDLRAATVKEARRVQDKLARWGL